ncbi:MAG: transcriptional regulator GcvA, partial [Alphaproteobacteria bacterium]|nr:transcriptional regulator GcvA [Alphaproteobacteria bacterium]
MFRRLPPLGAIRAFEAAARHLSFTKAAAELFVTQAAVSHQIKALESHLGVPLFRRLNRAVRLTDAGQAYLPTVREAFDLLDQATRRLVDHERTAPVRVSVLPSFAAKWLLPRLSRFRARNPGIDVTITAAEQVADLVAGEADLAIRYGHGRYPGLRADFLRGESVFPVCSPALLAGEVPLATPADLRHHTLLHDDHPVHTASYHPTWREWLKAAGVAGIDADRGSTFNDAALMVQAAIQGHGVALGRDALCADDLASGRLVRPFDLSLVGASAYYVVTLVTPAPRPAAAAFRQWLLDEAAASAAPSRSDSAPPPSTLPGSPAGTGSATIGRATASPARSQP